MEKGEGLSRTEKPEARRKVCSPAKTGGRSHGGKDLGGPIFPDQEHDTLCLTLTPLKFSPNWCSQISSPPPPPPSINFLKRKEELPSTLHVAVVQAEDKTSP